MYQQELEEIHNYISYKLLENIIAERLIKKIIYETQKLSYSARSYYILSKSLNGNIEKHRLLVKNYIILYQVDIKNKKVYLVHIFYSKRDYFNF